MPPRRDGRSPRAPAAPVRARARAFAALLVAGLGGAGACLWSMLRTESSARVPARLGLERVANHWDGLLSLLALPAFMFCAVLAVWAAVELHRLWRAAADPLGAGRPGRRRPPGRGGDGRPR